MKTNEMYTSVDKSFIHQLKTPTAAQSRRRVANSTTESMTEGKKGTEEVQGNRLIHRQKPTGIHDVHQDNLAGQRTVSFIIG